MCKSNLDSFCRNEYNDNGEQDEAQTEPHLVCFILANVGGSTKAALTDLGHD